MWTKGDGDVDSPGPCRPPLLVFPLSISHVNAWKAGERVGRTLLAHLWAVGSSTGLGALGCLCLGINPPCLFLLPVQMPKLCAAAGFELLETN